MNPFGLSLVQNLERLLKILYPDAAPKKKVKQSHNVSFMAVPCAGSPIAYFENVTTGAPGALGGYVS